MSDRKPAPLIRKPAPLPDFIPSTSDDLTVDHVVREIARIAFDPDEKPSLRLQALKELGKHKGMFIERTESRSMDLTKVATAQAMFKTMSPDERRAWLKEHESDMEAGIIEVKNTHEQR